MYLLQKGSFTPAWLISLHVMRVIQLLIEILFE